MTYMPCQYDTPTPYPLNMAYPHPLYMTNSLNTFSYPLHNDMHYPRSVHPSGWFVGAEDHRHDGLRGTS